MMAVTFVMFASLLVLIVCLKMQEKEYRPSFHSFEKDENNSPGNDPALQLVPPQDSPDKNSAELQKHVELEQTSIPLTSYLSPSMYMLLLLKVVQSFAFQVYCIAAPVVFAADFDISAQIGGILYGLAAIFGVLGIFLNTKIGAVLKGWEYPYDIVVYFVIVGISCMSYVVFYKSWIAYSFHILAMGSIFTLFGIEMTCRLFLCPAQAFQQITGIVGVFQVKWLILSNIW